MCQKDDKCPTCLGWEKVQEALDAKLACGKIKVSKDTIKKAIKELLAESGRVNESKTTS